MKTPIFDLVLCMSQAVDLVSPLVADHHIRTAQIAYGLGLHLNLPETTLRDLVIAAALHDVGGLTRQDRLDALDFEYQNPYGHSVNGYLLLKTFTPFHQAARIVRFHHVAWQYGAGTVFDDEPVPIASHLLQLADRVAILIDPQQDVINQVAGILTKIQEQAGERFVPQHVAALEALAEKEAFWLDAVYMRSLNYLNRRLRWEELEITQMEFKGLADLFRRIVDFRSPFTATHSAGVAAVAERLALLVDFSPADCWLIHLAGLLHDLGKLAVPAEILEKPTTLTKAEFDQVRRHTYYTFHILEPLKILDLVRVWGAFHHERLDGHGYPFHLDETDLPLGSRIVAVADIFTALTEDRPYRPASPPAEALALLMDASAHRRVDHQVVAVLRDHLTHLDSVRRTAQQTALDEYRNFVETAERLTPKTI
ncbi:MAG TPA: HD domain-containing phosphohydrolase [Anaerolineaceae bacterium]